MLWYVSVYSFLTCLCYRSSAISSAEKSIGPALLFETKNKALDNVQTSLGSWGNSLMNQQVGYNCCLCLSISFGFSSV